MARPKLSSPDQPLLIRSLLRFYEALASLRLAVLVIGLSAAVLAWATLIERDYGTAAVRFGVYGTWWFAGLLTVLGMNVLCAALIRFPWKRYQTGFVITHSGILVLLAGCLLSRMGGVDAQMHIFEGTTTGKSFEDSKHFELVVYRPAAASPGETPREEATTVRVPFASGPFNWQDYGGPGRGGEARRLQWFPWRLSDRGGGILYDRDGIQLEVLNYFNDSRAVLARPLVLEVREAAAPRTPASAPTEVPLSIEMTSGRTHLVLAAAWKPLPQDRRATFWMARTNDELLAFLNGGPKGEMGRQGQLELTRGNQKFLFNIDQFPRGERLPLGETGLDVEIIATDLSQAADLRQTLGQVLPPSVSAPALLHLRVHGPAGPREMLVPASLPALEVVLEEGETLRRLGTIETEYGLFAAFWGVPKEGTTADRLDLLHGPDGKLYGRAWDGRQVRQLGEVTPRAGNEETTAFASDRPVAFKISKFERQDRPGAVIRPVPFRKPSNRNSRMVTHRVLARLTVDGQTNEFWLEAMPTAQFPDPPNSDQRMVLQGAGRRVAIQLQPDVVDVGFDVRLRQFDRRLDPGTSMASHYSSVVDILERPESPGGSPRALHEHVVVKLNNPKTFSDPNTGRSYRLFQESFTGPWKPTDAVYRKYNPTGELRDQLFISVLTVNYDPGRGLKYTGSLLIVAGIVVMFYMRAYFFKPRGQQPSTTRRS